MSLTTPTKPHDDDSLRFLEVPYALEDPVAEMTNFLMSYYGIAQQDAEEILSELTDITSLRSLATHCAARAVIHPTPPTISTGQ